MNDPLMRIHDKLAHGEPLDITERLILQLMIEHYESASAAPSGTSAAPPACQDHAAGDF